MCPDQRTILVVDDDSAIRDSLSELLQDEGYLVARAQNGQQALEFLRANGAPCLILLDLMMPVMDGFEFIDQQRGDPALAGIPVVVITAAGDHRSRGVQARQVLPKPIRAETLMTTVRLYC
jgi:CheY-like chemotaxis protein